MVKTQRSEHGFAVVLSLVVLLLVSIALALLAVSLRLEMVQATRHATRARLTALSDAALATTLAHLAANRGVYRGLRDEELDGGTLSSRVKRLSRGRMQIEVTVRYRGRVRVTEALVQRRGTTLEILRWWRIPGGVKAPREVR